MKRSTPLLVVITLLLGGATWWAIFPEGFTLPSRPTIVLPPAPGQQQAAPLPITPTPSVRYEFVNEMENPDYVPGQEIAGQTVNLIPTALYIPFDLSGPTPDPGAPYFSPPSGSTAGWQPFNMGSVSYAGVTYPLDAYVWGSGSNALIIVGGIHGGHEANGTKVVNLLMQECTSGGISVPNNLTIYVIPVMNPYGAAAGSGITNGRTNGNLVDLNRNWGYKWVSTNTYHGVNLSAGTTAFSEIETQTVLNLIRTVSSQKSLRSVAFMHCCWDNGVVFASRNGKGSGNAYASSSGYRLSVSLSGNHGEARDYLGEMLSIQSLEIELPTWTGTNDPDWANNKRGMQSLLNWASGP